MLWLLMLLMLWLLLLLLMLWMLLLWMLLLLPMLWMLSIGSFTRWCAIAPSASPDACCRTDAWLHGCAAARLRSCGMTSDRTLSGPDGGPGAASVDRPPLYSQPPLS